MIKKILLSTTALLLMSGCVVKEKIIVQDPINNSYHQAHLTQPTPIETSPVHNIVMIESIPSSAIELKTESFAGERLTATPDVSRLVAEIETLTTDTAYLKMSAKQNVKVGGFLNIEVTPNKTGYLKIMIIDPNGERSLILPNDISGGHIKANQRFYSNNSKFAFKATNPTGLHYVVMIFSEQNARMEMRQGANGYNATRNDKELINMLSRINAQEYGRSNISIFPMRIY